MDSAVGQASWTKSGATASHRTSMKSRDFAQASAAVVHYSWFVLVLVH